MTKVILATLTTLLAAATTSTAAHAYESNRQRVLVDCRGYMDKVMVRVISSFPPEDASQVVTTVEVGYVVKTWAPKETFEYDDSKDEGRWASLEGTVGVGHGLFKYAIPYWNDMVTQESKEFTTAVTLKTGLVKGKASMNCIITLKNLKTQIN